MTRLVRFANNATSKLAANLSAVGLTISLVPGDGAKFPTLSAGQFFKGTLIKADGTKEVVKVTARTTDTLTVVRANEAVGGVQAAYAFSAGDKFELRLTAQALSDELDRLDAAAFLEVIGKNSNYTITEADITKLIKVDTGFGAITVTLPQISTLTASFEVQVQKNTGDTNIVSVMRAGSDTINGLTSYNLGAQYQSVWLVADLATNTWSAITSASASNRVIDQFTGSGTPGPFTLSGNPGTKANTDVYVGGVYQNKSTYTLSGTSLTLGGNVAAGVLVEVGWSQALAIGTPSDGTVTTAKFDPAAKAPLAGAADTATTAINAANSGTTAGSGTAYTLAPTVAITAYTPNLSFWVAFHAASGNNPTLQISGVATPPSLVRYNLSGALVNIAAGELPAGFATRVTLLSATQALVEEMPPAASASQQIQTIGASVAANALTITAGALSLDFRNTTLGSGTVIRVAGTPANLVVPSTATLGTINAVASRLVVLALNNAGTIELAAVNLAGGNDLSETGLISTTAISAAATSASVVYSTTARTGVAYRVIGYIESTQAAAGTWATAPSTVQGQGGQALAAMQSLGFGQTYQNVIASRVSGTTYYNTTGRPIFVTATATATVAGAVTLLAAVAGANIASMYTRDSTASGAGSCVFFIVPPGASYSVTMSGNSPAFNYWSELR